MMKRGNKQDSMQADKRGPGLYAGLCRRFQNRPAAVRHHAAIFGIHQKQ